MRYRMYVVQAMSIASGERNLGMPSLSSGRNGGTECIDLRKGGRTRPIRGSCNLGLNIIARCCLFFLERTKRLRQLLRLSREIWGGCLTHKASVLCSKFCQD